MTDHEHMPPIPKYTAVRLTQHQVVISFDGTVRVLTWGEAHALATAITEALQMERRG